MKLQNTNGIEMKIDGSKEIEMHFLNGNVMAYVTFAMSDDPEVRCTIMKDGELRKDVVVHRFRPATKGVFASAMADYLLEVRQCIAEDMKYDCDVWELFHTMSLSKDVQIPNPGKFQTKEAFINHILRRQRSIDEKNMRRLIGAYISRK